MRKPTHTKKRKEKKKNLEEKWTKLAKKRNTNEYKRTIK
jgi:hypothetical protein